MIKSADSQGRQTSGKSICINKMSLPPQAHIYTGPWINWSKDVVYGSTITLSQRSGSLLTAFLGIFVTVAGAACWRIISFLIHQYRATKGPKPAIHYQEQSVLRNNNTAGAAAWQMTQVAWAWRKKARRSSLRSLALICLAMCHLLLFAIAGVFSAEITKAIGTEELIRPSSCGRLMPDPGRNDVSAFEEVTAPDALDKSETIAASAYSRACYNQSMASPQCRQYPVASIEWTNRTVPCPFGGNICKETAGGFEMDTGLIDSHQILGINARSSDRVQYRKVTTCSVLRTTEYAKPYNDTESGPELQQLYRYYYGSVPSNDQNYTFQYNLNDGIGSTG